MKQYKIVNACKTINALRTRVDVEYPLVFSRALYVVSRALQDQWDFQIEEERKFADKCEADEDGRITFYDPEDKVRFVARMRELSDMDIDLDYIRPKVPIDANVNISYHDYEVLADFIDFE